MKLVFVTVLATFCSLIANAEICEDTIHTKHLVQQRRDNIDTLIQTDLLKYGEASRFDYADLKKYNNQLAAILSALKLANCPLNTRPGETCSSLKFTKDRLKVDSDYIVAQIRHDEAKYGNFAETALSRTLSKNKKELERVDLALIELSCP